MMRKCAGIDASWRCFGVWGGEGFEWRRGEGRRAWVVAKTVAQRCDGAVT